MRLDQYLSRVGIIKRRTVAKDMADNGLIKANGNRSKPSYNIKIGDIIQIGGNRPVTVEIINIPAGNVKKEMRPEYFKILG
jgi:ribosomal 50S subunit-recycling heat shock protein